MTSATTPDSQIAPPVIATSTTAAPAPSVVQTAAAATGYVVLIGLSVSHLLNDMIQSLLLAIYPLLKETFSLSFAQIGLVTLVFQITASLLQPLVGRYTDKRPLPWSLPMGMGFTLIGLVLLSQASSFPAVLFAAAMVGTGSSIFHPESSRIARLASGGKHGLAQSLFQVGGNLGASLGPLLAALIIIPRGQGSIAWFSLAAMLAMIVLGFVSRWYKQHLQSRKKAVAKPAVPRSRKQIATVMALLIGLLFSKYFYLASLHSYFTFYLIERFALPVQSAQMILFAFLFSVAAGTLIGGPIGDRIGRLRVIRVSILGVAPFTLLLPHANLFWTVALVVIIGLVIASAFAAIIVYAQDLVPGNVGTIAGIFFGLSFGLGGIGAAVLGRLVDTWGITTVFGLCAFLPLLGILALWLPDLSQKPAPAAA
jgi:FSR family fosmidomycin resistance protein-like MFS transporter